MRDLGRCSQVSRAWRIAAEDTLLWQAQARSRGWSDLRHWTLRHSEDDVDLWFPDGTPAWKQVCYVRTLYDQVRRCAHSHQLVRPSLTSLP